MLNTNAIMQDKLRTFHFLVYARAMLLTNKNRRKRFVSAALRFGVALGTGTGPVDPAFAMHHRTNEDARGADGDGGDEEG